MKKHKTKHKDWFKQKGYIHFTNKLDRTDRPAINKLVQNKKYVAKHAFYPILFYEKTILRRNKKPKKRPIGYATHLDTQIFSFYAKELREKYEKRILQTPNLSDCVIGYRSILNKEGKGKRNIHFAKEVFDDIKKWGDCKVLLMDIRNFFPSIDHLHLKKAWAGLLNQPSLPPHYYNIYKAVTKFSYIRKKDLQINNRGFDEAYLAQLRKKGIEALFGSAAEFREKVVQNPAIKIYKNQRKVNGRTVGIPYGFPISPVLVNLYMLEFDELIVKEFVQTKRCVYKRYSDDIIIICKNQKEANRIEKRARELIKKYTRLQLANEKTERFTCQVINGRQIIKNDKNGKPYLTYLGFEFYGYQTLIKSSTLANYYRKMKKAIQSKVYRMEKTYQKQLLVNPALHTRKLYRSYTHHGKKRRKIFIPKYKWEEVAEGEFIPKRKSIPKQHWGNFITYAYESAEIMNEKKIKRQVRRHIKIFKKQLDAQLKKYGYK